MVKKWNVDRPREGAGKLSACEQAGFTPAQCERAKAKITKLLRENLGTTGVDPEPLLNAMLPAIKGQKKIEITEHDVRVALRKVLDTE